MFTKKYYVETEEISNGDDSKILYIQWGAYDRQNLYKLFTAEVL